MPSRTAAAALAALLAAGLAPAAEAGRQRKPISKVYTVVDPTPAPLGEDCTGVDPAPVAFAIPAAGTLTVELSGYVGDWGQLLCAADGSTLAEATGAAPQRVTLRSRRAQRLALRAYNSLGSPRAIMKLTFVYA